MPSRFHVGSFAACWGLVLALAAEASAQTLPASAEPTLVLERYSAEPDVVTPVGIAVDPKGRVLVVESHTHFRPKEYAGPPADRIRILEDRDGDGKAETVGTFFEGSKYTMGLGFHPNGSLYVATRWEVFRLRDENGDGKADGSPESLAKLETPGDYPHNGLSGFAFDPEGRVYFGLGENLGAEYKLVGHDGTTLAGGGEGGNVYRMAADGSKLERIATGFWNPFHLAFDPYGRLYTVDNDPDSRPPCRLIHVVLGGDYGYRFRNGRRGLHPFTAWNGELPGTLPMSAGTGEAPSGIVSYDADALTGLRGGLVVTSWGDHRIDLFTPTTARDDNRLSRPMTRRTLASGGEDFRPVGIAIAPDGSMFVSDWVDRSYTLHGKGRVWHLRARDSVKRVAPTTDVEALVHADRATREAAARRLARSGGEAGRAALRKIVADDPEPLHVASALDALAATPTPEDEATFRQVLQHRSEDVRSLAARRVPVEFLAKALDDTSAEVRSEAFRRVTEPGAVEAFVRGLGHPDPFYRQASRVGLGRALPLKDLYPYFSHTDPAVRLGALLVLRDRGGPRALEGVPIALKDDDPDVRFVGIQWVGEQNLRLYRWQVRELLDRADITPALFEAGLAALERLDGTVRKPTDEQPGEAYIAQLVANPTMGMVSPLFRRALRSLRPDHPVLTGERLLALTRHPDPGIAREALRSLRERPIPGRFERFREVVLDKNAPRALRLEALAGLSLADLNEPTYRNLILDLATERESSYRYDALRALRGVRLTGTEAGRLEKLATRDAVAAALVDTLAGPETEVRDAGAAVPVNDWLERLKGAADPAAGERVFFHPKGPGCYRCHKYDGRGGRVGPDLTLTGKTLTRERLVESIVAPSKEISPQFTTWNVALKDGRVLTGTLLGETIEGSVYGDAQGQTVTVKPSEIEEARPAPASLMPADLHRLMTEQEFRDLLAFLSADRNH